MKKQATTEVVIIGAGLTGLTLAYYLKKQGIAYKILEKEYRVGGVIQSVSIDGFTYECGPNTGAISNPEVAELFEDLTNACELEIANPAAKKRLIWKKGKWHALPSGLFSAISTPLFTFFDKIRILGEPFRKKGTDPMESVASMIKRRLGKSFLDYAIDPFVGGIYAGDPNKLVTKYALPKMYNLEYTYGSLVIGGLKKSKENKADSRLSKATKEVFSAKNGLNQLIKALEKSIHVKDIVKEVERVQIAPTDNKYITSYGKGDSTYTIASNFVVTTTGAYTLGGILSFLPQQRLAPITNLKYAKIALLIAGYNQWNGKPIDSFGGLIPSKEKKNLLGILFTSAFFKNRAPQDGALLSIFVGGEKLSSVLDLSDDELKELAFMNIKEMMGTHQEPDIFKVYRYENAIAQYEASSKERLETIARLQNDFSGLILAGNIRDGIGMGDRIKQGRDIANLIAKSGQ
jgi:oxygen-dependent protoporphyrinogen oxidase